MTLDFFQTPGRFYRGNLHTHSDQSDGALTPQEVCRRYQAEGYDFIALTDHFIGQFDYPITDTQPFRNADFTTLLGAEVHSGAMENGALWHLVAAGLPAGFTPPDTPGFIAEEGQETAANLARRCVEAGAFVAIAHPHWSLMSLKDARSITAAHAVEIYNHGCAVDSDRGEGLHTLDMLLSEGRRLNLIATDDAHFSTDDAFGGWVMVKAEENTPEALLAALKQGNFYSSQGPEIQNITVTDDFVEVACTSAATVILQGQGVTTSATHGTSMTRASVALKPLAASPWLRVTIIDAAGKRAWSNPIWRD